MNKFIGKMGAGIDCTIQGMKDASANCKVDGKVCGKEKEIQELTAEIGNLAVKSLDEKRNLGPEILERYDAILAARKAIQEAEKDRVAKKITCPKCGAKTRVGMRYCGHCGQKIVSDEIEV